jgi:hypothetical protein
MHLNDPGGDSVMLLALNPDIFLITFSNKIKSHREQERRLNTIDYDSL